MVDLPVGAAYVFYSADGISGWSQTSKLIASDGAAGDYFSRNAVSIHGNVIAVGAADHDPSGFVAAGK